MKMVQVCVQGRLPNFDGCLDKEQGVQYQPGHAPTAESRVPLLRLFLELAACWLPQGGLRQPESQQTSPVPWLQHAEETRRVQLSMRMTTSHLPSR